MELRGYGHGLFLCACVGSAPFPSTDANRKKIVGFTKFPDNGGVGGWGKRYSFSAWMRQHRVMNSLVSCEIFGTD